MVSIITCTMRPSFMENIFNNYVRQDAEKKEMIIVLNRNDMDINKWREKARKYKNVDVYQVSEEYKLGKCLNYGIERAKYDIIAKFDDDDYYTSLYLREALEMLNKKRVSIIGKHTSYIYFEEKKALMLYRKGGENKYRGAVKGGTLVFRRSVWEKTKFDEKRVSGSDVDFLRKCEKRGYRIYSVSKHNYVCVRRKDLSTHTQKTDTDKYMARCKLICCTNDYIPFINKRISSD